MPAPRSTATLLLFPRIVRARRLLVGGAAFVLAELALRRYRHSQLFLPSPEPVRSWDPADYGIPREAVEEHWIETSDGEMLHAWYCRAEKPVASGLFCHGNTGNLTISADIIPHLLNAGLNILFFDYRGFGKSSGSATYGGVISDGVTAARFHDSIRPRGLPSILYGFSLGGAVGAQVIRRHPFDALILQSTFTSLSQLTRLLYPRLPLHLFARKLFDTARALRDVRVPLLVLHGTKDEVCPCVMAHELYDSYKGPKRIHCVEGALHKDLYLRDADALEWALSQFLADLTRVQHDAVPAAPTRVEQLTARARRTFRRVFRRGNRVIASAAR